MRFDISYTLADKESIQRFSEAVLKDGPSLLIRDETDVHKNEYITEAVHNAREVLKPDGYFNINQGYYLGCYLSSQNIFYTK